MWINRLGCALLTILCSPFTIGLPALAGYDILVNGVEPGLWLWIVGIVNLGWIIFWWTTIRPLWSKSSEDR